MLDYLHDNYHDNKSIKGSTLTGKMSQIGRIWHRMYPRYNKLQDGTMRRLGTEYIELLTIFPDDSNTTKDFLKFLPQSDFTLLYRTGI